MGYDAAQEELKHWDEYTKDGFVAGSSFTLAGIARRASLKRATPCKIFMNKHLIAISVYM